MPSGRCQRADARSRLGTQTPPLQYFHLAEMKRLDLQLYGAACLPARQPQVFDKQLALLTAGLPQCSLRW